jgi:hypothetical protein
MSHQQPGSSPVSWLLDKSRICRDSSRQKTEPAERLDREELVFRRLNLSSPS